VQEETFHKKICLANLSSAAFYAQCGSRQKPANCRWRHLGCRDHSWCSRVSRRADHL